MARIETLTTVIRDVDKRLTKLEVVKQPIGADVVQIVTTNIASLSSGSIASGDSITYTATVTPTTQILNLWDILFSFYIDTDSDVDYLYPSGSSLTSAQKDLDLHWSVDLVSSDDDTGERIAKITIVNNDSSSHIYHMYTEWSGIKQSI